LTFRVKEKNGFLNGGKKNNKTEGETTRLRKRKTRGLQQAIAKNQGRGGGVSKNLRENKIIFRGVSAKKKRGAMVGRAAKSGRGPRARLGKGRRNFTQIISNQNTPLRRLVQF